MKNLVCMNFSVDGINSIYLNLSKSFISVTTAERKPCVSLSNFTFRWEHPHHCLWDSTAQVLTHYSCLSPRLILFFKTVVWNFLSSLKSVVSKEYWEGLEGIHNLWNKLQSLQFFQSSWDGNTSERVWVTQGGISWLHE